MRKFLPRKPPISRRRFIRTSALALGAASLVPTIPLSGFVRKKLAVIPPVSSLSPNITADFVGGLKSGLAKFSGANPDLVLSSPVSGPNSAQAVICSLIEEEGIDLIAGVIGSDIPDSIRKTLSSGRTTLISCHCGENIIRPGDAGPWIIDNSMNIWQANWVLGNWTAGNIGKKAVIATSFYDSGYDALHAFYYGFENGGGEILGSVIDNLPAEMSPQPDLQTSLRKHRPDVVFAAFAGHEAVSFWNGWEQSGFADHIPVVASAFAVEPDVLTQSDFMSGEIYSCIPWKSHASGSSSTQTSGRTGNNASPFGILGHRAAEIASRIMDHQKDSHRSCHPVSGEPSEKKTLPDDYYPFYISKNKITSGRLINEPVQELTTTDAIDSHMTLMQDQVKTGWLNPYLCV